MSTWGIPGLLGVPECGAEGVTQPPPLSWLIGPQLSQCDRSQRLLFSDSGSFFW